MSDSVTPRVSVVMPVFNGESYLRAAVESILSQTMPHFELIVVDDGSSDGTGAILASYTDPRLIVVRHERNRGIVAALNEGIATARGELIARQDADDVSLPRRLELQVAHMTEHPEVSLVATDFIKMDESGCSLGISRSRPTDDLSLKWALLFANHVTHSSVMFRREAFEKGGRYRESDHHAEDYGLWTRIARIGSLNTLREPLLRYRYCADAISRRYADTQSASALRISADYMQHVTGEGLAGPQIRLLQALWAKDNRWLSERYNDRRYASELRQLRTTLDELIQGFCATSLIAGAIGRRFRSRARKAFGRRVLQSAVALSRDRDGNAAAYQAALRLCWHALVLAPGLSRSTSIYRTLARAVLGTRTTPHQAGGETDNKCRRAVADDVSPRRIIERVALVGPVARSTAIPSARSAMELLEAEDRSW